MGLIFTLYWWNQGKKASRENSLAVQWLGLCAFNAEGLGLIPVQGTKVSQAAQQQPKKKTKQNTHTGLPWWGSGWESACQCRGHGFKPWSGKIPHAAEQLGPWATMTEPARLEPVLHNKRGRDSERPAHQDEEWPPLAATGESPCTETKTQHSHK